MSSELRRRGPNATDPAVSTPTRKKSGGGGFFGLFAPKDTSELPPPENNLRILVEIVSARGLLPLNAAAKDGGAGSVYATVKSNGDNVIHTTRPARGKTLDPIWTVLSSSLYLLDVNDKVFEVGPGLTFEVLTGRGALQPFSHGTVTVGPETIAGGNGERMEFELVGGATASAGAKDDKEEEVNRGTLALRFRRATEEDVQFMTAVQPYKGTESKSLAEDAASEAALFADGPADFNFTQSKPPWGFQSRKSTRDPKNPQEVEMRVQPCPDPDRIEETTWLSSSGIDGESLKPSKKWAEAGKGEFGTLYLEIIGCDKLPNLDAGVPTDKTDSFVAMLFEDKLVRTDVIFDRCSPRWMPWSQRAFAFPIKHPTSPLVLGVFDYDEGPLNYHDAIGRVVINMENFECDTVYLLRYTLHSSPTKDDDFGSITFRLRLDYSDEKKALVESFSKPPRFHVNVASAKAYEVLKYLCKGQVHMDQASTETVSLYAYELLSYFEYYLYAIDFIIGVLLWRGEINISLPVPKWLLTVEASESLVEDKTSNEAENDSEVKAGSEENQNVESEDETDEEGVASAENNVVEATLWFPLHSIVLFLAATITIENPHLIPATFFLGLAWIIGTIGFEKSHHPYVWERCKSIGELSSVMVLGRNVHKPANIDANVGVEKAATLEAINKAKTQRILTALMAFKTAGLTFYNNYYKTDSEAHTIETETKEWSLFGAQLYYAHLALSYMCKYSRGIRDILTWRSCYHSYFLWRKCLLMGLASLIIPWGFVIQWIARIFAWLLLGPWMKLFDIFVVRDYYRTRAELINDPEIAEPDVESLFQDAKYSELAKKVRIALEDSVKLKEMREYRFGKFSAHVPTFDESRFPSVPLPESTAKPYGSQEAEYQYLKKDDCTMVFVPGQRLRGTMIHKAEDLHECDEDCGDAKKDE